jgi:hypothetical protein
MALVQVLVREHVDFDPRNAEHRKAYVMLQYHGRQHPDLRFNLKHPHTSVLPIMQEELAKMYCFQEMSELNVDLVYEQQRSGPYILKFEDSRTLIQPFLIVHEPEVIPFNQDEVESA